VVKYRGKIQVTKEMTKRILGIPEGLGFDGIEYDREREIYSIYVETDQVVDDWTWAIEEGGSTPSIANGLWADSIIEKAIEIVMNLPEYQNNELFKRLLVKDDD
jgi:hypothetical protein